MGARCGRARFLPCLVRYKEAQVASTGGTGKYYRGTPRADRRRKGIDLLECASVVDHVHLLIRVESARLPEAMRLLKGASSYQIFRQMPDIKLDAGTNSL